MIAAPPPPVTNLDERALTLLATGVSLLSQPAPSHLPDSLELGLQCLQALARENTGDFLDANWLWWEQLEKPLTEWWPGGVHRLPLSVTGATETLLHFGTPTALAMEWAVEGRRSLADQLAEIDERVMYAIWQECQTGGLQSVYTASRRFLIKHPVASDEELADARIIEGHHPLVAEAYEPVPPACITKGQVRVCPKCGDALVRSEDGELCRNWRLCQRQPAKEPLSRPAGGLRRVRRGIFDYVVSPGLPELALYDVLSGLPGTKVELWPDVDAYDLRITLPDGHVWAADVKQVREPFWLGRVEAARSFIPTGSVTWDKAYYVIANFYDSRTPDLFCQGAGLSLPQLASRRLHVVSDQWFLNEVSQCATFKSGG